MKPAPLRPARLGWRDDGRPFAPDFGDVYHPAGGALAQARDVFLAGCGLPGRWQGHDDFVVLELGFGLGNNFLATWAAWRADPSRSARLHYLGIDCHPPTADDLASVARDAAVADLAAQLGAAWPLLLPDTHRLAFDDGRVQLLLVWGDAGQALRECVAAVDAVYLDGFAPDRNPALWDTHLMKAIARLCRPGATAATWSAARTVREALAAAGFDVQRVPGPAGKRHVTHARFAPRHAPRPPLPGRPMRRGVAAEALIVGGGLAGCATAMALAEVGWRSVVLDCHAEPATEASGNPAGIHHGTVHPDDGVHARWTRATALQAAPAIDAALGDGVPGSAGGLLRLVPGGDVDAMRALLAAQGLPADYVQALDADAASARAGVALTAPAWYYARGGWVAPAALARWYLRRAGRAAAWRGGCSVHRIERRDSGWALLDDAGRTIAESATVVLANAGDAPRLLGAPGWPIRPVRGQISGLPLATAAAAGLVAPRLPLAGAGYLLPAVDGRLWFGATAQADDAEPGLRDADHRFNLARLASLTGVDARAAAADCAGRVGWRWRSRDGLPLIGAVPRATPASGIVQTRLVPREPGLFVFAALGARGITGSVLGARLVAAWVAGTPSPVEASLLEAVDPARFAVRAARRGPR